MLGFVARRFAWLIGILLVLSLVTFALMHALPGGPWDRDKPLSHLDPELVENLNQEYGLDKPVWEQYGTFLWNALHGDLGLSYKYGDRGVTEIIMSGFPATFTLAVVAFVIAIFIGISLGMVSAMRHNTAVDYLSVFLATIFVSTPGFIIGLILMIVFGVTLDLLPVAGWGSPAHIILPALALSSFPTALIARVTRASVLDVLQQDYVRTARAKGLPERVVMFRHVLRNAMIPILTISGPEWAFLISGSVIIETVFAVPGIGRLFVIGVFERDYGLIMGGS